MAMSPARSGAEPRIEGARPTRLAIFVALALAAIVALGAWDEQRESSAALDDFAREQATLAGTVASLLSSRLAAARDDGAAVPVARLLGAATPIERPGAARLLVRGPCLGGLPCRGPCLDGLPCRGPEGGGFQ